MRKPIALCAAFAVAAFSFVASEAQEVRIGDFVFGCKTSDGQVRKPQFGDMNGVFYTDIRGQEKACRDAVKRMIANCHQHTRFLNPGDNRKYPECLPVFQEQADECAAFFQEEIARCSGDGAAAKAAATTNGVLTFSKGHGFSIPWAHVPFRYEGGVRNGKPHGRGVMTGTYEHKRFRIEGEYRNGKPHGRFESTRTYPEGEIDRIEAEYRDGKQHGIRTAVSTTPEGYRKCTEWKEDGQFAGNC